MTLYILVLGFVKCNRYSVFYVAVQNLKRVKQILTENRVDMFSVLSSKGSELLFYKIHIILYFIIFNIHA